ncbi:MAG: glycosyltransferase family 4 protein, partial [Candidatus Levybacteria bacterium]|nr:glycosyltransferase family 4 protein [Candidatus Levybacteria bacterium]
YPHIGGVEKHVLEISRLLIEGGHKVTIVTEQNSSKLNPNETVEGIRVIRIPKLKEGKFKKFQIWKWLWNNSRLINDADIIHCHDVFFWYLPFRFIFPLKKVFTTFHGYESYPLKFKNVLMRKISEKLSMGNICIGDFINKWYGTKPTHTSYGAAKIPSQKLQAPNIIRKESALFIGRLHEQTGILTYVKAIKEMRKKNPNFDFLVIGDGVLKNKISGEIKTLGSISNAIKYFKDYNFAFVSRYLSILEAMAAKRLVFAVYDNPIKEDYLKMAPFAKYIIISGSSSELVSKMSFYLNNDNAREKEKMVEKAYAWVKKNTWKEMVNTYLKLWDKNL